MKGAKAPFMSCDADCDGGIRQNVTGKPLKTMGCDARDACDAQPSMTHPDSTSAAGNTRCFLRRSGAERPPSFS